MALGSMSGTATSPAPDAFSTGNRMPLSPLGMNNGSGFGLRQRRQEPGKGLGHDKLAMDGPPRKSLTVDNMASQASIMAPTSGATTTSDVSSKSLWSRIVDSIYQICVETHLFYFVLVRASELWKQRTGSALVDANVSAQPDGFWVLVYGFHTSEQYEEVLEGFRAAGNVIDVKGAPPSGSRNWVALNYESELAVEKAVCKHPVTLKDGCICGVQRLGKDIHSFLLRHKTKYSTSSESNNTGETTSGAARSLFTNTKKDDATTNDNLNEMEEDDILMENPERSNERKTKCESLMAWIYGW